MEVADEIRVMEEVGLPEAEAKVYLALLETGRSLAGPIIKKTGLHRGTTYQVLQRLKEKGLVSSVIIGKKQHFQAAEPERLLDLIKEKEEKFNTILPKLHAKVEESNQQQDVTVYTGVKGVWTVLNKALEEMGEGGEYCDFGVSGLFREVMGPYWDRWQAQKEKRKIKSKVIFTEELREKESALLKDYYGEARFHPKEYNSITDTIIYNDTVILCIWTAKPPVAIVIRNGENAESYRNQFRFLWEHAKE